MSPKHVASPSLGALKRRKIARLTGATVLVAALTTTAGAYLANPSTDPLAIETIPTAAPAPNQPSYSSAAPETVEGGQGGGNTPDSALGDGAIGDGAFSPGTPGQGGSANNSATSGQGQSPVAQQAVQWPLPTGDKNITSGFGPRKSPCAGCSSNHRGLDFAGPVGMPVGSISAGIVIDVSFVDNGGLGVYVVVEHRIDGKSTRSVYAHLQTGSPTVQVGDMVLAGERIGSLGNTGSSTGPHLHLEIIVQGTHVDPYTFLKRHADGEDVEIIDRPSIEWEPDQDPDSEGEGWNPDEDTLEIDPESLPDVQPDAEAPKPTQTTAPTPTPGPTTKPTPTEPVTPTPTKPGGDNPGTDPKPTDPDSGTDEDPATTPTPTPTPTGTETPKATP
ncbi:MAG: M23 family metallopeptidase [Gulosibacter sp.]|uniref:M23 family metallopeptidase n=1 Tax=Gulosibacter sp. TaxID=2817531 RepID=UPI003F922A1A